jgi:diaminohydroxyphosphoribosylaminopyrimidine deaminase/5-amino-6-(5-phosphoribosylamino)uracil reductase
LETGLWHALLGLRHGDAERRARLDHAFECATPDDRALALLYQPLVEAEGALIVAHLGQSLDGRIALADGQSKWITGKDDVVHNHRMRALFDAVLVGARTVLADDPQLNVREVDGPDPVRVVLDPAGRLGPAHGVFTDHALRTVVVRRQGRGQPMGPIEVIEIESTADGDLPRLVLKRLAERGLTRVFVEGGGVTVSRFLEAGCLDRLQISVAPVILGSGRPAITLPAVARIADALRPPTRRFILGDAVLFEMIFRA